MGGSRTADPLEETMRDRVRSGRTFVMGAIGAVGVLAVGAVGTPASAQADCETYGRLALQQQRENEQRRCGFKGPEWSSDLKAHVAWCARVGPNQWRASVQSRAQKLATECARR